MQIGNETTPNETKKLSSCQYEQQTRNIIHSYAGRVVNTLKQTCSHNVISIAEFGRVVCFVLSDLPKCELLFSLTEMGWGNGIMEWTGDIQSHWISWIARKEGKIRNTPDFFRNRKAESNRNRETPNSLLSGGEEWRLWSVILPSQWVRSARKQRPEIGGCRDDAGEG